MGGEGVCGGDSREPLPILLDLLRSEEEGSRAAPCLARALAVYSPAELADAGAAPLFLQLEGDCAAAAGARAGATSGGGGLDGGLPELLAAARAACATVAAFLRVAAARKVVRDAVNFERDVGVTREELAAQTV
jgi:hypothetical protein